MKNGRQLNSAYKVSKREIERRRDRVRERERLRER